MSDDLYGALPEGMERMKPIPTQRVIARMDAYLSRRDYAGAERHLLYWLEEARLGGDLRGELMVRNELVGHYRKTGNRPKAMETIEALLDLLRRLDFGDTLSAGTSYVNIATALGTFGEHARALPYFQKARALYEASGRTEAKLLGGLYNNMGLTCAALKRWEEGRALYARAMEVMENAEHGALEQAITCLNLANLAEAQLGMENAEGEIFDLLDQAEEKLADPSLPRDGYYAFVCESCAPTFEYYGYFARAEALREEAKRIYERP